MKLTLLVRKVRKYEGNTMPRGIIWLKQWARVTIFITDFLIDTSKKTH